MSYLIFARKYRPRTFEEMIGQKSVVQTLQNAIRTNRVTQAYLFSGMRGVGKTTAARILAKALNCLNGPTPTPCNECEFCDEINDDKSIDVLEIDGASNRGIEDIRAIRESLKYKPVHSRTKIIIIDEVHQVTGPAFNALLKTLEEPPENSIFIFATTEFHKVPATIVSRCQHFEFKKISHKDIINHLMDVANKESLTISPYALSLIAEAAEGSLRDAQSLLDQAVAFSGEIINDTDIKEILGAISRDILFECSTAVIDEKADAVFGLVDKLVEGGIDLRAFFKDLIEHFRNLLLVSSVEKPQDFLFVNAEELARFQKEAKRASSEDFLRDLLALQQGEAGLRYSSHPRIFLEALLVKLCHFRKLIPIKELIREIGEIKREAGGAEDARNHEASSDDSSGGEAPAKSKLDHGKPRFASQEREPGRDRMTPPSMTGDCVPGLDRPAAENPVSSARTDAKNVFAEILENTQKEKAALAAVIAQYSSFKIKDGYLDIYYTGGRKFYIETIRRDSRLVERIASEVLGRKMTLRLFEDEAGPEDRREKEMEAALKDPTVRYFMNTFKAKVMSVDPIKKAPERG